MTLKTTMWNYTVQLGENYEWRDLFPWIYFTWSESGLSWTDQWQFLQTNERLLNINKLWIMQIFFFFQRKQERSSKDMLPLANATLPLTLKHANTHTHTHAHIYFKWLTKIQTVLFKQIIIVISSYLSLFIWMYWLYFATRKTRQPIWTAQFIVFVFFFFLVLLAHLKNLGCIWRTFSSPTVTKALWQELSDRLHLLRVRRLSQYWQCCIV